MTLHQLPQNRYEYTLTKILTQENLRHMVAYWRFKGLKIAFTNGCFDILHKGHIDYLAHASALADILIVGVNTDASVKRLGKGANRPLQDEESRSLIIASLSFVDAVILFDEDTPLNLITQIKPDVLIKGADYTIETVVGAKEVLAYGGKVELLPYLEGYSTTKIEEKIKGV
ncbi:MAG: D-glycero-beta-D-manno-heptose 1-phosphate adenylyltransferase [Bacteroidetes bacterium]|nr:D-glycero-beta-D-manno-heptose 1-phosphate adenylyltransferase [Bacteroidota bacterium]